MDLLLRLDIPKLPKPVRYEDRILLIGSCFTEHMAARLGQHKFKVLSNPHGILFNPLSVADALDSYVQQRTYGEEDLFYLNELWNSWDHHSRFSHPQKEAALQGINASQSAAGKAVRNADWIIVTLGTAFQYFLTPPLKGDNVAYNPADGAGASPLGIGVRGAIPVANNHRAPAQWFEKRLLDIEAITDAWTATLEGIFSLNASAQIMLTVSPVRHIRDGAVANNRSKGRLLEAVHRLCERFPARVHYFPAYELVVDVLRDYRFYDLDLVHPNYLATDAVWEEFVKACIAPEAAPVMEAVRDITTAASHRPRFPGTDAHRRFKESYRQKIQGLLGQHPYLDLGEEQGYFERP